jgi:hypothetical protein
VDADQLEQGREYYAQHAWREAFGSLPHADQAAPLGAGDIELLATSAYMTLALPRLGGSERCGRPLSSVLSSLSVNGARKLDEEAVMPIAMLVDNPEGSQELYEKIRKQLGLEAPAGGILHFAGPSPTGGWRVIEVWESEEDARRFLSERFGPAPRRSDSPAHLRSRSSGPFTTT